MGNTLVRRTSRVGTVLVFMLIFGVVLGVLPAIASAASTASVSVHNVLAGQDGKVFQVTVNNTESGGIQGVNPGATINRVRILPPANMIDAVLPGSAGPTAAWSNIAVVGDPPAEIRFSGGNIEPGDSAVFTVAADIRDTFNADSWENWLVRVSSNAGQTTQASTATGELLRTDIRILQVQSVAVVAPTGASDDRDGDGNPEVTGSQGSQDTNGNGNALDDADDICIRTRVFSAAATAIPVTPGLSGNNVTVGPARPSAATPCSAAPLSGGSASINPGTSRDFDFRVSFANVSSATTTDLTGTATAPGASTPNTPDPDDDDFLALEPVDIEPKSLLTYEPDTLTPRAVVPSDLAEGFTNRKSFSIEINKAPAGSPPVNPLAGNFASDFCNAALASPTSLPGGSTTTEASFAECVIADIDDGRYQPRAFYSYTDANGLIQGVTELTGLEQVRLDSLIPNVTIDIIDPISQVVGANPPTEPAVTNGQPFSATGDVTDTDPDTDTQKPCGNVPDGSTTVLPCDLVKAELIQYPLTAKQGGGEPIAPPIDVTPQCSLSSSGTLSCNITTSGFVTGVQSTRLSIEVEDETDNPGEDISDLIDVDIIAPFIETAAASRGGTITLNPGDPVPTQTIEGQRRTVVVTFNEPVQNSNNPQDWRIQEGGQTVAVCGVNQSEDMRTLQLITCSELPADPEGVVTYDPSLPTSSPYHDRVGEETVIPLEKTLLDKIAPLAPTFTLVNNRAIQDGAYFFNTPNPSVTLVNAPATAEDPAIKDRYTLEVYEETDGEAGLDRTSDTLVCGPDVAAGPEHTFGCDFGSAERTATVYAVSLDTATPQPNVGTARVASFVLDTTRPVFAGATASGTSVVVNFNEPLYQLVGRDFSEDWLFFARRVATGTEPGFDVSDVATGATNSQKNMTVSGEYTGPPNFIPLYARYRFDGDSEADRYEDRAGNKLLNGNALVQ